MTDGGRFIAGFGGLSAGLCFLLAIYFFVREYVARAALPPEIRTPEMIQYHFDGEVELLSLTFGYALLFIGFVLAGIFSILFAIYEASVGHR